MSDFDVEIGALRQFRDAVHRYWYEQRNVTEGVGHTIQSVEASLEGKARRWRARLEESRAELESCRARAAYAAEEGGYIDCSSWEQAAHEAQEKLEHIDRWRERVDREVSSFRGKADRFRNLLEIDVRRAESHVETMIAGLVSARDLKTPGA
jgi:hypothetical protein